MPLHSGPLMGHVAGRRRGRHPLITLFHACAHTLRESWRDMQGEVALTVETRPARAAGQVRHGAWRLQLSYDDTPLTPGAPRLTATAALLRADGTDVTASQPPAAWTWRQASGLSMRAGYGAVTVDTDGAASAVSVCPRGVSLSLSGTSRPACQDLAAGVEVTVLLASGERLSQRVQAGLPGTE